MDQTARPWDPRNRGMTCADRVRFGAELLDEHFKKRWAILIPLEHVFVYLEHCRPLALLFIDATHGAEVLGLRGAALQHYGFAPYNVPGSELYGAECYGLTAAWRRAIEERQERGP